MTVFANLVIGQDGSTTANGASAQLSSPEDRKRFHELRKRADAILIGGNTARNEPYGSTPKPLIIVTKMDSITEVEKNPNAIISHNHPKESIKEAQKKFGENILIEGGPKLLLEVIEAIDELYITIANRSGDGQQVSFDGLTRNFIMENMEKINGEIFYKFTRQR